MLNEPIGKRYRADGKENFQLTPVQSAARNNIAAKLRSGYYPVEVVNCPLCGGSHSTCLSEKDTYGLPVRVVACSDCGLVFNNPRLAKPCLPAFYSEDYRELDRVLPDVEAYFQLESGKGKRILHFLEQNKLLPRLHGKLVVDIGCGAGGVLGYFKQAGYDVMGCDLVPAHLEYGRGQKQLDLHYGSLRQTQQITAERKADIGLVIYEQVFEHLPDPKAELQILHEMLGSGSLLFIGVPGLRNIDEQYSSDFLRFLQLPHLVHYDLDHLVALMAENGFEFLAGNEIAQAVFIKTEEAKASPQLGYEATATFLVGLEQRRRKKVLASWVCHFPSNFGRHVKSSIQHSALPAPIKEGVIDFLRRIKRITKN
jgi:SAM-dependent methyltransferase